MKNHKFNHRIIITLLSLIVQTIANSTIITKTPTTAPAKNNVESNDDNELTFCNKLPDNCWCDFGDDSLIKLIIQDQIPATLQSDITEYAIILDELLLFNLKDSKIELSFSLKALRIFNSSSIDLYSDDRSGMNVQTLEIVNSTFVSSQPFKFILEQNELKHILLSGTTFSSKQLSETFGRRECTNELRELRLNHRCDPFNLPFEPLELNPKMFQSLCKLRVLDLDCVPLKLTDIKSSNLQTSLFSNSTLVFPMIIM